MSLAARVHGAYVHDRRVRVLSEHLAALLPRGARVLDVGCGDGLLSRRLAELRPDIAIRGIDVLVREGAHIPVTGFDGRAIPFGAGGFDVVLFVDVLHHAEDPLALLREGARVAGRAVVIKDHTRSGPLAGPTLRFMDRVGNARHGVALPYNYWTPAQWRDALQAANLRADVWHRDLGLYPRPADWVFGRSLHFVARLVRDRPKEAR